MKLLLTILLFTMGTWANAQYSLSAGFTRIHEGTGQDLKNYFGKSREQLYLQDYFNIRFCFEKWRIKPWGSVMYLPGKADVKQTTRYHNGGGSSPSYTYTYDYYSTIEYNYVALKIGFDYLINAKTDSSRPNKKWKNYYYVSPFFQYDALLNYKEYDHYMIYTFGMAAYDDQGQYLGYWNYTEYPPDYEPFESVKMKSYLFPVGLELKWRTSYQQFFLETGIIASASSRSILLISERENQEGINVGSFIRFGYKW